VTPGGNADGYENKRVAGKAIRKTMKIKELQIDGVEGATHKCMKTLTGSGQAPGGQKRVMSYRRRERAIDYQLLQSSGFWEGSGGAWGTVAPEE
jgi:hypothetical protein